MNFIPLRSIARHRPYATSAIIAALLLLILPAVEIPAQDIKMVAPEKVGLSSERLARLDKAMQEEIDQKRKAGIVVLIARRGLIAHFKAYGMADIESGVRMRTDNIFKLFSQTKPITSVALLMLYEQGKFQLTDPLEKYIPAFKDVKVFAGLDAQGKMILEEPKRKITIQDVFRHTAGFSYGMGDTPVDRAYQQADIRTSSKTIGSLKELIEKIAQMPLLYQPGERWVYSFAHEVQAYLIEYFSGMRFDDFVHEEIFKPLGMKSAVFGIPKDYVARFATIYGPGESGILKAREKPVENSEAWRRNPSSAPRGSGGGGISCAAMDYLLFSQMVLNGGKLGAVRILGKKTIELMTSNNLPPQVPDIGSSNIGSGYGLGVSVLLDLAQSGNLGSKGQFGWGGAAGTKVNIDPKEEMISLFFVQYMPGDRDIQNRFQTLVYQAIVD